MDAVAECDGLDRTLWFAPSEENPAGDRAPHNKDSHEASLLQPGHPGDLESTATLNNLSIRCLCGRRPQRRKFDSNKQRELFSIIIWMDCNRKIFPNVKGPTDARRRFIAPHECKEYSKACPRIQQQ